ncbi:MAG TPA: hypothetical protein VFT74_18525 [Isosphaeraceae bacterium]|nr:hypothetical protein [Isosphaeraceae bacterium]
MIDFDPSNPQAGFGALLVCGEADSGCLFASPSPNLDPKIDHGTIYESARYAERRDDIDRLMFSVMMQAKDRLNQPAHGTDTER